MASTFQSESSGSAAKSGWCSAQPERALRREHARVRRARRSRVVGVLVARHEAEEHSSIEERAPGRPPRRPRALGVAQIHARWTLSFGVVSLPEINLSTLDTRGGRLPDIYEAGVRPLPLAGAYDAADGCHTKPTKANEPGFSRSANRSYRHISDGYGSWKGIRRGSLAPARAEKDQAKLLSFASRCARAPRTPPRATKVLRARPSCLVHRRATKGLRAARASHATPPHKRTRR